jgi:hypothetical protein
MVVAGAGAFPSGSGGHVHDETVLFDGRLAERPREAPRCGDVKVAVGHKFEVVRVKRGTLKDRAVVLLIPCPDLLGEHFLEVGAEYLVEASSNLDAAASYTVYNEYADARRWWAVSVARR